MKQIRFLLSLCALAAAMIAAPVQQTAAAESTPAAVTQADAPRLGWRGWLRKCVDRDEDRARYAIHMEPGWQQASADLPVVVQLHGFNSTPGHTRPLLGPARQAGLPCGQFAYPNDQPLRLSAELLSAELKCFAKQWPERDVALVTHSMGGLVARECIEDDALYPGNVRRLIMVAPPTHGSSLARYAVGLDVWEHWLARRDGNPWRRIRESIADGLSEAPTDLRPGSAFLQNLNSRPRREGVSYTLLLGSSAQLAEEQRYFVRQTLLRTADRTPGWQADAAAIDRALSCMDEVVEGLGDGAVAIDRGRLAGVDDTVVLPFSHLGVVRAEGDAGCRQAQQVILDRLLAETTAGAAE